MTQELDHTPALPEGFVKCMTEGCLNYNVEIHVPAADYILCGAGCGGDLTASLRPVE